MTDKLAPKLVLKEYEEEALRYISMNERLTVDAVIDLSVRLFTSIQIKGVDYSHAENDMLLFQCGTYNWGDEKGDHASYTITRQFQQVGNDEYYQVYLSLIFDPSVLDKDDAYNTWSSDYSNLDEWIAEIRETVGYSKMKQADYRSYEIFIQET